MKIEQIGIHEVKIYDSIEDLPAFRFWKYNKMLLIDSCIGSDLDDVNNHIHRAKRYIQMNQRQMAMDELENMRKGIHLINESLCPKHLAFAVLVAEIDGVQINDISDDSLKATMEKLKEVKKGWLDNVINQIKKKIDKELMAYFPATFDDISAKEYYDKLKQRVLLKLDTILKISDNQKLIEQIDDFFMMMSRPKKS